MHLTFELFSDFFALRQNAFTRQDPRVKLFAACGTILAVILSGGAVLPAAVLAVSLGVVIALRVPARLLAFRLAAPLGMALVLCVLRAFLVGSTPLVSFSLWGWQLTATREGAAEGGLLAARVLACVSVLLVLGLTTPAHQVFAALRWARVPKGWVEIAMLMYRYIFALLEQVSDVFAAQQVRLGYSGVRRSLRSMGTLVGSVLVRSMEQAEKTHEAMVARGYRGELPVGKLPPLGRRNAGVLALCLAAVGLVFLLAERWPF